MGDGLQGDAAHVLWPGVAVLGCVVAATEALLGEGEKLPNLSAKEGQGGHYWARWELTKPVWSVLCGCGKQNKDF